MFGTGVDEGIWETDLCRPLVKHRRTEAGRQYFYDHEHPVIKTAITFLEERVGAIADELSDEGWVPERAGLQTSRSWRYLLLRKDGEKAGACADGRMATACAIVEELYEIVRPPKEGQAKLSAMEEGTVVRPHAGPTDERVRIHCGIAGVGGDSYIRVGDEQRGWEEGRCFAFDESCEHEVRVGSGGSGGGGGERVVLIVDIESPFLIGEGEGEEL